MSIEENKAILYRWFGMEDFRDLPEAELEKTMRKVVSELFDPDFVMHTPEGEMPLEVCVQHTLEKRLMWVVSVSSVIRAVSSPRSGATPIPSA